MWSPLVRLLRREAADQSMLVGTLRVLPVREQVGVLLPKDLASREVREVRIATSKALALQVCDLVLVVF
ncbi:unnamed protein product [Ectocarpus sp. CCAP 1310/34]|nr:unnamed protein product [Ectocarpus sp. CCAP 1310/34]